MKFIVEKFVILENKELENNKAKFNNIVEYRYYFDFFVPVLSCSYVFLYLGSEANKTLKIFVENE